MDYLALDAQQCRPFFDAIVNVYKAAFAQPPYLETLPDIFNFAARLPYHALNPGFRCILAQPGPQAEIVGFAYGYAGFPRTWWYELVAPVLPTSISEYWLGNYFELAELALLPGWQGLGVGGGLHDRLLEGLSHRTAALSTPQAETNALHLYHKRGWVNLIEHFHFPGIPMEYRIMAKALDRHIG